MPILEESARQGMRAYQKKMVEWAEKKYLDMKVASNLTLSQLVKWFLELPVVQPAWTTQ